MGRAMNLQVRRLLSVTAVAAVAVISVATSPAPVGLSDCRNTVELNLDGTSPEAQAHFTYHLNATGNPVGSAQLAASASVSWSVCAPSGADGGCDFVTPDGGVASVVHDDARPEVAEAFVTQATLFQGCPQGSACDDGLTATYRLPVGYSGAPLRLRFNTCGSVTLGGGNLPRGSTFTVTEP